MLTPVQKRVLRILAAGPASPVGLDVKITTFRALQGKGLITYAPDPSNTPRLVRDAARRFAITQEGRKYLSELNAPVTGIRRR